MTVPDLNPDRDLIFVSLEAWDEVWRRNQFLCALWAERFPQRKILFVEPMQRSADQALRPLSEYSNIVRLCPAKAFPNSLAPGRALNQLLMQRRVQSAARELRLDVPLLWINDHHAAHLCGTLNERATIYDITDDWTLTDLPPQELSRVHAGDEYLCRRADLTIVCSQALLESRRARARKILLLPNGVRVSHYQNLENLRALHSWPRPVFGYTGTLHRERLDADLVVALAREYSSGSVVLIGPDCLDDATRALLQKQSNIHLTGAISYDEIPRAMAGFDVCIVPHLESAFVESLNPLKLWEYLAAGLPIAATNVSGFRDFSAVCDLGSGTHGFLKACDAALKEARGQSASKRQMRREIAARHDWNTRLDQLLQALQELKK